MFKRRVQVRFKDCDPAGIVFYPRYFEMINDTVEDFFAQYLEYPFHKMAPENGVPTAGIETRFLAPSRHGDDLVITFSVRRLGRTSMTYDQTARCGEETRFETVATLVHVDAAGRPVRWPDAIAEKLRLAQEDEQDDQ